MSESYENVTLETTLIESGEKPVSIGGWVGTILLSCVPAVNIILWLIWAFAAKRRCARAEDFLPRAGRTDSAR